MKRWTGALQNTYKTPTIELVSGKGSLVKDSAGKAYLDFLAGIATNILGHAHPAVVKAINKQSSTLGHVSNFYAHPSALALAGKLRELTGDKTARTFFCNSGAEANEAALKLSRKTGRSKIVATQGSFHGRTMGSLSLTGQPNKQRAFLPLLPNIKHVPYGDVKAMKRAVNRRTAMVIVEPILGEAGVVVPPVGYLESLREICDHHGAILVFDCVQTGMGRTGDWFGYEYSGIRPDVITLAKGLGGGLPLGAMIAMGRAAQLFEPGDHGTTFGGNPIATAAGLAVIETLTKEKLLANSEVLGSFIMEEIALIPGVAEVRGAGLLIGIELKEPVADEITKLALVQGLLINAATDRTIRIAPALNISKKQAEKFISIFASLLNTISTKNSDVKSSGKAHNG
ncbi:ArgD Ornithine/acetylornithine aminotransferase [Candidatus Nanopelagicaceae bacterium]